MISLTKKATVYISVFSCLTISSCNTTSVNIEESKWNDNEHIHNICFHSNYFYYECVNSDNYTLTIGHWKRQLDTVYLKSFDGLKYELYINKDELLLPNGVIMKQSDSLVCSHIVVSDSLLLPQGELKNKMIQRKIINIINSIKSNKLLEDYDCLFVDVDSNRIILTFGNKLFLPKNAVAYNHINNYYVIYKCKRADMSLSNQISKMFYTFTLSDDDCPITEDKEFWSSYIIEGDTLRKAFSTFE